MITIMLWINRLYEISSCNSDLDNITQIVIALILSFFTIPFDLILLPVELIAIIIYSINKKDLI